MSTAIPTVFSTLLLLFTFHALSRADQAFDVRQHLSTVTRYGVVNDVVSSSFVPTGCTPIHLNLVARHGTRSPTKKRMTELDTLASHLKELLSYAENLDKVPAWLRGWESPWKEKRGGGELILKGEDELYHLGIRIREKFPDIFNEEYHSDIYTIKATQVSRAAASAVAFGMGLLSVNGTPFPGEHRAFAVLSENLSSDIMLRFFDNCENYKEIKEKEKTCLKENFQRPVFDEIASALKSRYGLNFTGNDTASLWFLCKQQATLLDKTDQACGLFSPDEVARLEWTDDLEVFVLKGYGKSINYRMGLPLLLDVSQSMEKAIKAHKGKPSPDNYEKATLRFAHAETLIPFSCLLGLFLDGPEFQKLQREECLDLPPKPPLHRNWRTNLIAPFAGNNMLVLYSCPADTSSEYYVQVLHNEHPIRTPGCDGSDFCPFEVFKKRIFDPHLQHDFNAVCEVQSEEKPVTCKLSTRNDKQSTKDEL